MVAFDLDGTLLGPNHEISDMAVQYLRSLHDKGLIISIATGRSPAACAEVIRRLNLKFPRPHSEGFPVVTTNGAKGIHVCLDDSMSSTEEEKKESNPMLDGRMSITQLFHQPVPLDLAQKLLKLSKSMGCVTNYYIDHDIYAHVMQDWHLEATKKYTNLTGVPYNYCKDDYEEAMGRGLPSKLLVLCEPHAIEETYQKIEDSIGHEAKVIRGSPPFFVEILNKEVCKGSGLKLLCDKLGVDVEECM